MAELAERNSTRENPSLKGWYTLTAADVDAAKCAVRCSPSEENAYHADIHMPVDLSAADHRDDLLEFARDLAYRAGFEPWGDWQDRFPADDADQPSAAPAAGAPDPD